MPVQFLPIIIGALATGGGIAINQNEVRRANKRAQAANETLRRNKERFEKEANDNLISTVKQFAPEERENVRQEAITENEALLANTLGRERGDFAATPTGKISNQFIDRRAETQKQLDERGARRGLNLARVTAPGQQGFVENRNLVRSGQRENTIRALQRGQLGVDALKVDEAGRVKPNFVGDLLTGLGPALITFGALGGLEGLAGTAASGAGTVPAIGAGTSATIPATKLSLLTQGGTISAGSSGTGTGLAGLPILANSLGPRRGFSRAN